MMRDYFASGIDKGRTGSPFPGRVYIREEVVRRGRELAADPRYPGRPVIRRLARMIAPVVRGR